MNINTMPFDPTASFIILRHLFDEAKQGNCREAPLYEPLDYGLNILARKFNVQQVTRNRRATVAPQPEFVHASISLELIAPPADQDNITRTDGSMSAQAYPSVSMEMITRSRANANGYNNVATSEESDDASATVKTEHPEDISTHTEPSAVATNLSSSPTVPSTSVRFEDRYAVPDFAFFENIWQAPTGRYLRKIMFLVEIKRLTLLHALGFMSIQLTTRSMARLDKWMKKVIDGQMSKQVQHAFCEFAHQDRMYVMCVFDEYWKIAGFKRGPIPDDATEHQLPSVVKFMETSVYKILREDDKDFHTQFKRRFTEIVNNMSRA